MTRGARLRDHGLREHLSGLLRLDEAGARGRRLTCQVRCPSGGGVLDGGAVAIGPLDEAPWRSARPAPPHLPDPIDGPLAR